ncbi:MAG: M14 family metallopeptidase [Vicinamibacterales bacterium]
MNIFRGDLSQGAVHARRKRPGVPLLIACAAVLGMRPGLDGGSAVAAQANQKIAALKTRIERTSFAETTRYPELMAFAEAVSDPSPLVHLTTFGYSFEGRRLPLFVIGNVKDASPEAVLASGKTRVLVYTGTHAGEIEGKEAMLMLVRSIASAERWAGSDDLVLLIVPLQNPDADERVTLGNRPRQPGPVGGVGERNNAQGLDLNRDHVKLDGAECRALTNLIRRYDPHVMSDLHGTNGTRHAYHITYSPPLNPNTDPAIVDLLRKDWFPSVTRAFKAKHGWDSYYYGNVPGAGGPAGAERGYYTFDPRPRYSTNYVGLRNRFAILVESYAYVPVQERIVSLVRFVEELVDYARVNAARIRDIAARADAESIVGRQLALGGTLQKSPEPVDILLGDVREEKHPYTGQIMLVRTDTRKPERLPEFQAFAPSDVERVPSAYYVPAGLGDVIDRLQTHGARVSRLEKPETLAVEQFTIASSRFAEPPSQGHRERTVTGRYEPVQQTLPAGTVVVPMDQPLARLIFHLLEPRSSDGLLTWNFFDDALKNSTVYPIVRRP